ncbi:MAG: substrate-binding domain-containing protein [Lachnospiraceae bacterium]|nr:substrate-binding domain-containing protein [Lachnospiraceae bacterium]
MIGKRAKIFILFYLAGLFVLFLMCSTDLIIREPEKEVYEIAVIIEDVGDDNYSNFRKGMDQAAIEYNADVHFITLYEKLDEMQQMELISREEQDGVDALIVAPVDEERFGGALLEKQTAVPVVLLSTGIAQEKMAGKVIVDYWKMGEMLSEKMAEKIPENCPVVLLTESGSEEPMSDDFLEGAKEVLKESGHVLQTAEPDEEEGYQKLFEESFENRPALLAANPEILAEMAGILAGNPEYAEQIVGLYGRGNTQEIWNDLDRELIAGICVTDEFGRGYFSVYMAVQALEGKEVKEPLIMESYYIEKKDLRKPEYEKILFPME